MRLMKRRAAVLLVMALFMTFGVCLFIVHYFQDASVWARHYSNDHLYSEGRMAVSGTIYDRNENVLFAIVDGEMQYNEDQTIRTALMHTTGDGWGNVATSAQVVFREKLMGWDVVNGAYRFNGWLSKRRSDLHLSLDADLCATAYQALNGRKGTVGVYNYETGEILCMVSSPSFDPADPPEIKEGDERYEGVYLNRFLSAAYTPGSVFKLVTVAAALDEVPGIEEETFHCDGKEEFGGETVTCPSVHGDLTFEEALAESCNIAFAEISLAVGDTALQKYADKAGFNKALTVDGIKTAVGRAEIKGTEGGDLAWAGIGQYTDTANPLNFMAYVGAIANDGVRVTPTFFSPAEGLLSYLPDLGKEEKRILSEETAHKVRDLMRNDVVNGYGEGNYEGLMLCAKTGTAEIGDDAQPHAWFAGFLDREDYPLAFVVVVENGSSGSRVAGPVAAKVLKAAVGEE